MKTCFICGDPVGDIGEILAFEDQVATICVACSELIASETDTQEIGEIGNGIE